MASKHSVYVFLGSFCIYSEKATCVYVLGTLMHCLTQNTDLSWNSIYGITASVLIDNFFFSFLYIKSAVPDPIQTKCPAGVERRSQPRLPAPQRLGSYSLLEECYVTLRKATRSTELVLVLQCTWLLYWNIWLVGFAEQCEIAAVKVIIQTEFAQKKNPKRSSDL